MRILAASALLPDGWRNDVLVSTDETGDIVDVQVNDPGDAADLRVGALLPGIANLHSHAFQRAMSGLAEVAGPAEDGIRGKGLIDRRSWRPTRDRGRRVSAPLPGRTCAIENRPEPFDS